MHERAQAILIFSGSVPSPTRPGSCEPSIAQPIYPNGGPSFIEAAQPERAQPPEAGHDKPPLGRKVTFVAWGGGSIFEEFFVCFRVRSVLSPSQCVVEAADQPHAEEVVEAGACSMFCPQPKFSRSKLSLKKDWVNDWSHFRLEQSQSCQCGGSLLRS